MSNRMPDEMAELIAEKCDIYIYMSNKMSEFVPDRRPKKMSNTMADNASQYISARLPDKMHINH
jgi:hypothetical protein